MPSTSSGGSRATGVSMDSRHGSGSDCTEPTPPDVPAISPPGRPCRGPVGAAAGREEILATQAVFAEVSQELIKLSEPRQLTLKGVRDPVEVVAIDWR